MKYCLSTVPLFRKLFGSFPNQNKIMIFIFFSPIFVAACVLCSLLSNFFVFPAFPSLFTKSNFYPRYMAFLVEKKEKEIVVYILILESPRGKASLLILFNAFYFTQWWDVIQLLMTFSVKKYQISCSFSFISLFKIILCNSSKIITTSVCGPGE